MRVSRSIHNPDSMTSRSSRGRWERVLAARRQAREAQGRDPDEMDDLFTAPPKSKTAVPAPASTSTPPVIRHPAERVEYVLTVGEAATRLGVARATLEAMIDAGKVEALPTGFTRMIPTREVERLMRATNAT
jgi:excisionase family DNA binding protein